MPSTDARKSPNAPLIAFDLGPFELPVAIVALLWLVAALIVLVTIPSARAMAAVAMGFVLGWLALRATV